MTCQKTCCRSETKKDHQRSKKDQHDHSFEEKKREIKKREKTAKLHLVTPAEKQVSENRLAEQKVEKLEKATNFLNTLISKPGPDRIPKEQRDVFEQHRKKGIAAVAIQGRAARAAFSEDGVFCGLQDSKCRTCVPTYVGRTFLTSNPITLPVSTLVVDSTASFPDSGSLEVLTDYGVVSLRYSCKTATSFTGVIGGTGEYIATGNQIYRKKNKSCKCSKKKDTDSTAKFEITNANLPLVITCPGVYEVKENLVYKFAGNYVAAIQIESSNVVFDFKEYTLSQCGTQPQAVGVRVGNGYDGEYSNITVKNGTIRDFSRTGVVMTTETGIFQEIHFEDLDILNNGTSSAHFSICQGLEISTFQFPKTFFNVFIERCHVNSNFNVQCCSAFACFTVNVSSLTISDCTFNNQSGFGAVGLYVSFSNDVIIQNSTVSGTTDAFVIPCNRTVTGLFVEHCNGLIIRDCEVNDTHTECCSVTGLLVGSVGSATISNVNVNRVSAGQYFGVAAPSFLEGVIVTAFGATLENVNVYDLRIDANNVVESEVRGFWGFPDSLTFINCSVSRINIAAPNFSVVGFKLQQYSNVTLKNCRVEDLSAPKGVAGIYSDGSNMKVLNSVVTRLYSPSANYPVFGIGFRANDQGLLVVEQIDFADPQKNFSIANNNLSDINADPENPNVAAILLWGVDQSNVAENTILNCQRGILLDGTNSVPNSPFLQIFLFDPLSSTILQFGWQIDPAFWPCDQQGPDSIVPILIPQTFTNLDRAPNTPVVVPQSQIQFGAFYVPVNSETSTWQNGDRIRYSYPGSDNQAVQLLDLNNCRNRVPWCGVANYDGKSTVYAGDKILTQDMIGGKITFTVGAIPYTANIVDYINPFFSGTFIFPNDNPITAVGLVIDPLSWSPSNPGRLACEAFEVVFLDNGVLVGTRDYYLFQIPRNTASPGFATQNVVKKNTVSGSSVVGFQDTRLPCTGTFYQSNTAFCNGAGADNYDIAWAGIPPVDEGTLLTYPQRTFKDYNVSVKCCQDGSCSCE